MFDGLRQIHIEQKGGVMIDKDKPFPAKENEDPSVEEQDSPESILIFGRGVAGKVSVRETPDVSERQQHTESDTFFGIVR